MPVSEYVRIALGELRALAHRPREIVCAQCGQTRTVHHAKAVYCSNECRMLAVGARRMAQRHAAKAQNGDAPKAG
mgnify:FL=1